MLGSLARIAAEMVGGAESGEDLVGSGGLASGAGFEAGEGSSGGGAGRFRGGMARGGGVGGGGAGEHGKRKKRTRGFWPFGPWAFADRVHCNSDILLYLWAK